MTSKTITSTGVEVRRIKGGKPHEVKVSLTFSFDGRDPRLPEFWKHLGEFIAVALPPAQLEAFVAQLNTARAQIAAEQTKRPRKRA